MASPNSQNHVEYFMSKVGIIGAGISGIAAAKQLSSHNPIVFEASGSIGGVWKHCSYSSTRLQTPRCDYEFSDYPWPDRDNSTFPSHHQVLDYLHGYAKHFDVLRHIKFNSRVVEVRYVGGHERTGILSPPSPGEYGRLLKGSPVWEVAVVHENDQSDVVQVVLLAFISVITFVLLFLHVRMTMPDIV